MDVSSDPVPPRYPSSAWMISAVLATLVLLGCLGLIYRSRLVNSHKIAGKQTTLPFFYPSPTIYPTPSPGLNISSTSSLSADLDILGKQLDRLNADLTQANMALSDKMVNLTE